MNNKMKCLQCGSDDIVKNVRAVDHTDYKSKTDFKLEVYAKPEAWIFKEPHEGTVRANVCASCGYIMFNLSLEDAIKLKNKKKET